ncbi:tRNA (adenosine(37)-N6)-threonylcarbamoyltransferase complex dimerization subunit type 1 TsaB [Vibrio sp.]|uniref:tRNA (adenosine(37)-N6)-threonylcarbamoyltransferase complex dimerization subunit type 1 TsaB n=1 Tax=Vibrio sp. TaxID=678 RepID=UPI003D140DD8
MSAKILALDTATENCSVALRVGDQTFVRSEVAPRDHTKKILPMVDDVLKEAGLTLGELDALAFGRGPGSFTGVRIGIGIAQGLAFGADLPMIGVSTLKAMAQGSFRRHQAEHVACAIDARMNEVYWGRFSRLANGDWSEAEPECVIPPAELNTLLSEADNQFHWHTAGTGWQSYAEELAQLTLPLVQGDVQFPEAEDIAFLAQFALADGATVSAEQASPVYLRDKVAWKKLPGRE